MRVGWSEGVWGGGKEGRWGGYLVPVFGGGGVRGVYSMALGALSQRASMWEGKLGDGEEGGNIISTQHVFHSY